MYKTKIIFRTFVLYVMQQCFVFNLIYDSIVPCFDAGHVCYQCPIGEFTVRRLPKKQYRHNKKFKSKFNA